MIELGPQITPDLPARTQISGKYSPDNPGVFAFKEQLVAAGWDVKFPVGDEIIEYECDFAITVPHESSTPFPKTEVQFLREIRANEVQTTYNIYGEREGYVGESTGVETVFALLCNKPIVMVREPSEYSMSIAPRVAALIDKYKGAMVIEDVDRLDVPALAARMGQLAQHEVDYGLSDDERLVVMAESLELTRKYNRSWKAYLALKAAQVQSDL